MCYSTMTDRELVNESVGFDSDSLIHAMGKMIDSNIDIDSEKDKLQDKLQDEFDDIEKELELINNNADSIIYKLDEILDQSEVDRFEVIYRMLESIST